MHFPTLFLLSLRSIFATFDFDASFAYSSSSFIFPLTSGRDLRRRLGSEEAHDLPEHRRKYSRFNPIHNTRQLDDGTPTGPTDGGLAEHDAAVTAPLFQGMGTHYADVWVGTPPQRKSVIVDTGSHYTAFPCKTDEESRARTKHVDNSSCSHIPFFFLFLLSFHYPVAVFAFSMNFE